MSSILAARDSTRKNTHRKSSLTSFARNPIKLSNLHRCSFVNIDGSELIFDLDEKVLVVDAIQFICGKIAGKWGNSGDVSGVGNEKSDAAKDEKSQALNPKYVYLQRDEHSITDDVVPKDRFDLSTPLSNYYYKGAVKIDFLRILHDFQGEYVHMRDEENMAPGLIFLLHGDHNRTPEVYFTLAVQSPTDTELNGHFTLAHNSSLLQEMIKQRTSKTSVFEIIKSKRLSQEHLTHQDDYGYTALHLAVLFRCDYVVEFMETIVEEIIHDEAKRNFLSATDATGMSCFHMGFKYSEFFEKYFNLCCKYYSYDSPMVADPNSLDAKFANLVCGVEKTKRNSFLHSIASLSTEEYREWKGGIHKTLDLLLKNLDTNLARKLMRLQNLQSATCLHLATRTDNQDLVERIFGFCYAHEQNIRKAFPLNLPDKFGNTPLHYVAYHGNENLLELFLDIPSSMYMLHVNSDDHTFLDIAEEGKRFAFMHYCLEEKTEFARYFRSFYMMRLGSATRDSTSASTRSSISSVFPGYSAFYKKKKRAGKVISIGSRDKFNDLDHKNELKKLQKIAEARKSQSSEKPVADLDMESKSNDNTESENNTQWNNGADSRNNAEAPTIPRYSGVSDIKKRDLLYSTIPEIHKQVVRMETMAKISKILDHPNSVSRVIMSAPPGERTVPPMIPDLVSQ